MAGLDLRDPAARDRPIVRAVYCRHLVDLLAEEGVTAARTLEGTGLTRGDLVGSDKRISYAQQIRIYRNALRRTGRRALGIDLGRRERSSDHGVLGYAVQSSANLRQALVVAGRFAAMTGPLLESRLRVDGSEARVELSEALPLGEIGPMARQEFGVLLWGVLQSTVPPTAVRAVRGDLAARDARPLESIVGRRVQAGDCALSLHFRARDLDRPLEFSDEETARVCEERCRDLMDRLGGESGPVESLRSALVASPGHFPSLDECARTLGQSGRTLRRRLEEAGTSFREVRNDVRRALALDYLERTSLPIDEIASLLGYSETPNFYRAFRAWTGGSPSAYRGSSSPLS